MSTKDLNLEERIEKVAKKEWRMMLRIRDENHLLYLAFLVLFTVAIILFGLFVINRSLVKVTTVGTDFLPTSTQVLTSSQIAKTTAYDVKISNVTENAKPDPAFTILPNETMLILNISITNKTNRAQELVPVNQLYVRSREGDTASMHPSMFVSQPLAAATVAPGETVTGQISFNVPKQLAAPLLYVDLGWNNLVPSVFDVLR